jgi:SAM-dependent methyltransferase
METPAPTASPGRALALPADGASGSAIVSPHSDEALVDALSIWSRGAGRILDYGAGDGRFAGALRERGCDVAAIEPDATLREAVRARGVPVGKSLELLGDERFGGAYALHALDRVEDDAGLLATLREHLVPGGRLLLCVPAFPLLYSAVDARSGSLRRYRGRALQHVVEVSGFRVNRVRHLDSLGFAVALWRRSFGQRQGPPDPMVSKLCERLALPLSRVLDALCGGAIGTALLCEAQRDG